jgi:hypothetical protein
MHAHHAFPHREGHTSHVSVFPSIPSRRRCHERLDEPRSPVAVSRRAVPVLIALPHDARRRPHRRRRLFPNGLAPGTRLPTIFHQRVISARTTFAGSPSPSSMACSSPASLARSPAATPSWATQTRRGSGRRHPRLLALQDATRYFAMQSGPSIGGVQTARLDPQWHWR